MSKIEKVSFTELDKINRDGIEEIWKNSHHTTQLIPPPPQTKTNTSRR